MKLLLTGNKGFIGTRLERALIDTGHYEVYGYDLKDGLDIRDRLKLEMFFEMMNFEVVIHCAALTGVRRSELYPQEYMSTNVMGTKNVVELAYKYGVKHLINFSSSSVYGATSDDPLKEDDPKQPTSIYGMTKLMAELIVWGTDICSTTVRPFTVYGEDGRADQVIYKWINQIKAGKPISFYGNGKSARGYTYVGDLIKGILKILEMDNDRTTGDNWNHTYNLGGDQLVTLNDLLNIFVMFFKQNSLQVAQMGIPPGDQPFNFANTKRARQNFGWTPRTKFKEKVLEILTKEFGNEHI